MSPRGDARVVRDSIFLLSVVEFAITPVFLDVAKP